MDQANFEASMGQGVAARTRGVQSALRAVVNGTTNLNVTTRDINQKKKGENGRKSGNPDLLHKLRKRECSVATFES